MLRKESKKYLIKKPQFFSTGAAQLEEALRRAEAFIVQPAEGELFDLTPEQKELNNLVESVLPTIERNREMPKAEAESNGRIELLREQLKLANERAALAVEWAALRQAQLEFELRKAEAR